MTGIPMAGNKGSTAQTVALPFQLRDKTNGYKPRYYILSPVGLNSLPVAAYAA